MAKKKFTAKSLFAFVKTELAIFGEDGLIAFWTLVMEHFNQIPAMLPVASCNGALVYAASDKLQQFVEQQTKLNNAGRHRRGEVKRNEKIREMKFQDPDMSAGAIAQKLPTVNPKWKMSADAVRKVLKRDREKLQKMLSGRN
jgi:hypothetical protein